MGFYSHLMGLYIVFMEFYSDLMGFYSDFMGFCGDLMALSSDFMGYEWDVPSGNLKLWKMAMEIVSLPINSMIMFYRYIKLPEGN